MTASDASMFSFRDLRNEPDPILKQELRDDLMMPTIVIDNGSYCCRAGWSTAKDLADGAKPGRSAATGGGTLVYRNNLARTKRDKGKDASGYDLHVANDIASQEAVRQNLRSPFDGNVVTQFETQEILLDYAFVHLGLNESDTCEGKVSYPVVMTEPFGNPSSCRAAMNELLFECYSVPKLAYGVDGLLSLYQNHPDDVGLPDYALIVSVGHHTVHVMPIVNGKVDLEGVRKVNVGGHQLVNHTWKALQLKYPYNSGSISFSRAEEVLQDHCHVSHSFGEELRQWAVKEYRDKNVRKIQLPYVPVPKPPPVDPEVLKQRRQELAKRLVEMNAKKREEKLQEDTVTLKSLITCRDLLEQGYEGKVKRILAKLGLTVKSLAELDQVMEKTTARIDKAKEALKRKNLIRPADSSEIGQEAKGLGNSEATETKAKRNRQNMTEGEKMEFDGWIQDVKLKRQELMAKRTERQRLRQQLSKRRTAASQERMRIISQLAKKSKKEDTFGMNDDDWEVYKKISKDGGDSESEEEQARLNEYESILRENDPNFEAEAALNSQSPIDRVLPHDSPEWYQLHLETEQIRAPEILFQPSIIGLDQAGVSETVEFILKKYPEDVQERLVSCVFVTGSVANLPGLRARLEADLQQMRPFQSHFRVKLARNPSADAWNGAKKLAIKAENHSFFLSREEYLEQGNDFLKEHICSNKFWPLPPSDNTIFSGQK